MNISENLYFCKKNFLKKKGSLLIFILMGKVQVLVCGGGPAGIGAAIAAKRCGAEVVLVERYGFLGGTGTNALVHPWMSYYAGKKEIIAGIFKEIVDRLKKYNAYKDSEHFGNIHHCFDPEILKFVLFRMITEEKIKIFLHTFVTGTVVKNKRIKKVILQSKSGKEEVEPEIVVDTTGDADIAFYSGVPYQKGREDGALQPATLHFRMGGVDVRKIPSREEINNLYLKAKKEGKIKIPRENLLWFDTTIPDVIHFNTTRILNIDGTNRDDLTRAEIEAREQVMEIVNFLKENVPGFEKSYLIATGAQIGIRETRRIVGEYILNKDDILKAKKHPDGIACGSYGIDIHNPEGEGTIFIKLKEGEYYNIPYRCLINNSIENLIVAGRCISTTPEAFSAIRIQPICYATGQAAGVAAYLSLKRKVNKINIKELQNILRKQNAVIE